MASNDASSASVESTVRVLASFFLATDETSSARSTGATHKEKFCVPLSEDHRDLFKFQKHLKSFTALDDIARIKGLGENPEVTIARVKEKASGGVETFSLRTQDAWQYEFETLLQGGGMLQATIVQRLTAWVTGTPVLQLVTKADTNPAATGSEGRVQRKKQKRVPSQEDEELYRKLREGKNVERNKRQEEELEKLKQELLSLGNSTTLCGLRARCGQCSAELELPTDRKWKGQAKYFKRKHYDSCLKKSLSSANSSKEVQRPLTAWLNPGTARRSGKSSEQKTSPPTQETINEEDPLELQDKDLSLNVVDDDFMILNTEGGDWSPKGDTEDPFACLDDDEYSLDSIMNCEQVHDHDVESVIEESTDDEISEPEDGDWKILPISLTAADDVCIKLDKLIQKGIISKDKIMYKYLKDTVEVLIKYDHEYDQEVIEFFNTIEYLGGGSTVNFLRGPMYHGQGRGGEKKAENAAFNLAGPSKRTRDKLRGGYTTKSGVLKDLQLAFMTLATDQTSNVQPLLETDTVKVIGVALENDGTALKPGIQFDDRVKKCVGLNQEINLQFVKDNPNPTPEFLKSKILTEANVSFVTSLCNGVSMPIATNYFTKSGKTGEEMKEFFLEQAKILQICKACLEMARSDDNTVPPCVIDTCKSTCRACLDANETCPRCAEHNQPSHIPSLRACKRCLDAGEQCIRCLVLILTTDCEEGNKKAMELIAKEQEDQLIDPALQYLVFLPDGVHVGKSLKCSFCNWFIVLKNARSCLAVIQTLRDDNNPDVRKALRRLLRAEDVQNKDRMAVDPILRLSNESVINTLREVDLVVHQLVPEKYRFSETNKIGMYPHPVAITLGRQGKLLFIDVNPLKESSRLVEADLHNPVRLQVVKSELPDVRGVCYVKDFGAALLCQREKGLFVVDLEDKIVLRPARLRDRASVVDELTKRNLSCEGTVKVLKERLAHHLQIERQSLQSDGQLLKLDTDIKPSSICNLTDRIIACSSDTTREVFTATVSSNGHFLCGTVSLLLPYPEECMRVQSMCLGSQNYLFLADTKNFWKFSMEQKTLERVVVLQSNPHPIMRIHSISALQDGSVVFTDQDSRQLKKLQSGGEVKVIAGTGEESNKNGSGSHSAFGQPMGVCTEGGSIFVTDGQIGTIKLVTNLEGTVDFLQNLGNLYRAFSVHHKHQEHDSFTLKEAHQMVKSVSSYCNGTIDNVKETYAIASTTNGPQGTIAAKTATSLNLLENGLQRLDEHIDVLSPGFSIKPEVCLTIQVENVHAVSHLKHPTCTVLEYSRDFGNHMKESLKRATKWSAYYFTNPVSYYPIPQTKVPLRDIPTIKRLPVQTMSKQDQDTMRQWASEHGKAVRQLSVRQNNTKHAAGTLPLNMYRKELPVGDRVTEEPSLADDQLSEYDSDTSDNEDSSNNEEDAVEGVPVNFLSRTVRTRTGRPITLSYRALSSY